MIRGFPPNFLYRHLSFKPSNFRIIMIDQVLLMDSPRKTSAVFHQECLYSMRTVVAFGGEFRELTKFQAAVVQARRGPGGGVGSCPLGGSLNGGFQHGKWRVQWISYDLRMKDLDST
jgi:hypothetical protein